MGKLIAVLCFFFVFAYGDDAPLEKDVEGVDTTNSSGEEFAKGEDPPIEFVEEENEKDVEGKLPEDDTEDHKEVLSDEGVNPDFGQEELLEVEDGKMAEDDTEDHSTELAPDDFEEEVSDDEEI